MATKVRRRLTVIAAAAVMAAGAQAVEINTGHPDLKLRWDNSVKYSNGWRLKKASPNLVQGLEAANQDDGDRSFNRGLISNRFDLLSEMDVTYRGFGARVSGAAWYDSVYNRGNDHDSPFTANAVSVPFNQFTAATEKLHGRKAEILDAFVFGSTEFGGAKATVRLGQHTVLWGESLFFGANGIAAGQAPIDVIKAVAVPGTQFKELIRPVPQVSGQVQLNPSLSIGAFYQFRWEPSRLPAAGSYFSSLDFLADGAERVFFGPPLVPGGGPQNFLRQSDMKAKDSGQGGVQLRFRLDETDVGLYALRYHDKTPQIYARPFAPAAINPLLAQLGNFQWVYPEGIRAFGASASHTFGDFNVAGEVSMRRNMPLASDLQVDIFGSGDNSANPLYAVGKSLHAQVSWLAVLGPNFLARESDFLGEIAWNRRTSVTKNPGALNPNADRDAVNLRVSYEPRYRQALPGVDIGVPMGLGVGFGNSSVVGAFNGHHVGDLSLGLNATYLGVWRFGLNYTHFFGPEGTFIQANHASFRQALKDRDFVSLSVQRSF